MKTFILAGGFATRLWPLTERRAKPLLPLKGKVLIDHLIDMLPGTMPITVSTNAAFAEGFSAWKATLHRRDIELVIEESTRDDHKLGALGALAQWISKKGSDDDLLLLAGDNYLGFSMERFLASYRPGTPLLAAHDIKDVSKASAFGTVILEGNRAGLKRPKGPRSPRNDPPSSVSSDSSDSSVSSVSIAAFEEKPAHPRTTLVSTGCSILPARILPIVVAFARSKPDNVGGIFEELLRRGIPIDCFLFMESWLDIGSFSSYMEAHRLLVGEQTLIDPSASLTGCITHGSVWVAPGCHIEKTTLQDCMIFKGCEIANCVLNECIIDEHCTLRGVDLAGKMVRERTKLVVD